MRTLSPTTDARCLQPLLRPAAARRNLSLRQAAKARLNFFRERREGQIRALLVLLRGGAKAAAAGGGVRRSRAPKRRVW